MLHSYIALAACVHAGMQLIDISTAAAIYIYMHLTSYIAN
jgi:hypothetical protein